MDVRNKGWFEDLEGIKKAHKGAVAGRGELFRVQQIELRRQW